MADPNAPAAANPFDQIDLNLASQTYAPPAAPANQNEQAPPAPANPFDAVDLNLAPATSATGSFLHAFERGLAPMAGGMAAVGAGAELGGAGGLAIGGPIGGAIGGFAGGVAGMIGGAAAVDATQNWMLSKLPDSWKEKIGQDDRQQQLEQAQHKDAAFLGGLAPYALTMSPGGLAKSVMKLPENATVFQQLMANPMTARVFGGGLVGGMEAGQELASGQPVDWSHVAIATGFGVVFNKPTRIGQTLTDVGAGPARAMMGLPKIEAPSPVLTPEGAPAEPTAPPATPVTAKEWNETILGQKPAPDPTIAAAADIKVMGPGNTESVYHGTQQQSPESEAAAQQARRTEMLATGEGLPEPDLHAIARRMEPETFTRYDELSAQREAFRSWIRDASNPPDEDVAAAQAHRQQLQDQLDAHLTEQGGYTGGPEARRLRAQVRDAQSQVDAIEERRNAFAEGRAQDTPDIAAARQHLLAVDFEMRDLATQVSAAYRRAADAVGAGTVPHEPEPVAPVAPPQAAVEPPQAAPGAEVKPTALTVEPPRPIEDQLAFIANDVMQNLVNAGRPVDEARAAGQLVASRYRTRATRFNNLLGTPEELYRKEGAIIRGGPGVVPTAAPAPAAAPAAPALPKPAPLMPTIEKPNFPTPAKPVEAAPSAAKPAAAPVPAGGIEALDPTKIGVDAKRFQFKAGGDEAGVTERLQGVEKWDPRLAGTSLVFRDAQGKDWIADGHQRLGLAKRLADAGQKDIKINAFVLREAEGLTDADAMRIAAAKNIAEGTGTSVDAAKVIRDAKTKGFDLPPLPPRSALVREGTALARLDPEAFGMVVNEVVPTNQAAIVGRLIEDPAIQLEAMRVLAKAKPDNLRQAELVVRELLSTGTEMMTRQGGLFGEEHFASSVVLERAKVADEAMRQLKSDRGTFRTLVNEAARIEGHGANTLDVEANKTRLTSDEQATELLTKLAYNVGPVSDALTAVAKKFKSGEISAAAAARSFLGSLRGAIEEGVVNRPDVGGAVAGAAGERELAQPRDDQTIELFQTARSLADVEQSAKARGVDIAVSENGDRITLSKIVVPEGQRGGGNGSSVMRELIAYADATGKDIALSPSADFGGSVARLKAFYKEFGFVENKGKNRDFTTQEAMIRPAQSAQEFDQTARGKIRLAEGVRPIITLMKDANASTFIHETGHQWLEEMARDAAHEAAPDALKADMQTVRDWLGLKGEDAIKTRQHEKFARGFEQYMREGVAPSLGLASVFAKFRNWLTSIYQTLKGLGTPISEDIRGVFDRLIETEPQRTVIAPDRPEISGFSDIHAADAAHIEPHEADPAMERIVAETNRFAEEQPPEIQNEIAEAEARAGSPAPAESAGESGDGAAGRGEVDQNRGRPDAIPTGRNGGEEPGKVKPGGGAAGGKGAGVSGAAESAADPFGPEQRRGIDGGTGAQQLAPGPTPRFGPDESRFVDKAGNIRLENLTTNEDVRRAIRDAAEENDDFLAERRGVVTDGQVMDLAADIGMDGAWDLVKKHVVGQAFSAEQVMALRKLVVKSATEVSAAMKRAADRSSTDEDVLAYAMAKERHQLIQGTVAGVTAEAGRALRAFRDISGEAGAQGVDQFIRSATGKTLFQLREEAKLGANLDTPGKISKFLRDAQKRSFGRMILEYWINGLISGPTTHATYVVGNTLFAVHKAVPETMAASLVGRVAQALGREGDRVRLGEVGAQLSGAVRGLPGAIESSSEAMRSGMITQLPGEKAHVLTPFEGDTQLFHGKSATNDQVTWHEAAAGMFGVVRGLRDAILAMGTLAKGGEPGSPLVSAQYRPGGQIPDIAGRGVTVLPLGTLARMPGRFVGTIDSFFRSAVYSMEKNAEAYRTAVNEGLTGTAREQRMADIRQNPSEDIMNRARGEATAVALMTHSGPFMQKLANLINTEIPLPLLGRTPLLKFVDPFVRVAGNVMDQSVMRRSPLGLLSSELRADVMGKNGNIAQDKAIARMLVGTALAITWGGLRAQGVVSGSGPVDRREAAMWRQAGNQAHSVRIGDIWYDVHRLEPLSMLMGIAADLYDVAETAGHGEYANAAAELHHAVVQNVLDESFMRGPAELMRAIEDKDRYGAAYVRNLVASFVPYSVGMSQITRAMDPYTRQARTTVDAMKAKVPWMSQELMPRRDIWGEPMPGKEALGPSGMTSIYETQVSRDPVNAALLDLHIYPAPVERQILNVKLNDQQYDDFSRLAGRTTKQRLDIIVNSPDFRSWPIEGKIKVIDATIQQSREMARGLMKAKYPTIPVEAARLKLAKSRGEPAN